MGNGLLYFSMQRIKDEQVVFAREGERGRARARERERGIGI